jgi:hypothetical protein
MSNNNNAIVLSNRTCYSINRIIMKSNKNVIGVDAGKQSFRNSKLLY